MYEYQENSQKFKKKTERKHLAQPTIIYEEEDKDFSVQASSRRYSTVSHEKSSEVKPSEKLKGSFQKIGEMIMKP